MRALCRQQGNLQSGTKPHHSHLLFPITDMHMKRRDNITSMAILGFISNHVILPGDGPRHSSRHTETQLTDDGDLVLRFSGLPSFSMLTCTFFEEIT